MDFISLSALSFFLGVGICITLTLVILKRSPSWGMDQPDTFRKNHSAPIPRLGGLPIFVAIATVCTFVSIRDPEFFQSWWPVFLGNTLIFILGFVDDLKPLGAKAKLIGQVGISLICYSLGVSIDLVSLPFGEGSFYLGATGLFVTIFWLIGVPNIINLIDGMDGLASGMGLFLSLTLAFVGHLSGHQEVVWISLSLSGALIGFLCFNFPPAKIFLGDGGAYLIGFFIASVSLGSSNKGAIAASILVIIVALGIPILDTFFAIARRGLRGLPLFRADFEHIHHRMLLLGFSKRKSLIILYTICGLLSLIGLSIFWSKGLTLPIAGAALFLLALTAARMLGYVKSLRDVQQQIRRVLSRRKHVRYAMCHAEMLEFEVERVETAAEFWDLVTYALKRMDFEIADSEESREDKSPLYLDFGHHNRLTLWNLNKTRSLEDAQTLADCLLPPLDLAIRRWGQPESSQVSQTVDHPYLHERNKAKLA